MTDEARPRRVNIDRVVLRGTATSIDTHRLNYLIAAELRSQSTTAPTAAPLTPEPIIPSPHHAAKAIATHISSSVRERKRR